MKNVYWLYVSFFVPPLEEVEEDLRLQILSP